MIARDSTAFQHPEHVDTRRQAMSVLASSATSAIAEGLAQIATLPEPEIVRAPESGLVMIRGRIGGDGAPFNLGEATVSRAVVRLTSGEMGFGYALGRDTEKVRLIAFCDALLQTREHHEAVREQVIAPLRETQAAKEMIAAERTAATRVDFFTLVRGED